MKSHIQSDHKAKEYAKPWLKIPLGVRLFVVYFVVIAMSAYMVSTIVIKEVKPTVRQATEETLVDMANLLAVILQEKVADRTLSSSELDVWLKNYGKRNPQARIWEVGKSSVNHRIYVTDASGIVISDSWNQDVGKDYSQWNDVYLTLRGEYGARSTIEDPNDPLSTVMHVAAPIYGDGQIIGSVTVAKANRSVQPFIDLSKRNVLFWMMWMTLFGLIVGGLFAWRIHSALGKLVIYAEKIGAGEKVSRPRFRVFYEYDALTRAFEKMRGQLDGKQYVEEYVQTLTHELKSPLSAIKGASEILQMPLAQSKVNRFSANIERESTRMQLLIDKLLDLARLEQTLQLERRESIQLASLFNEVIPSFDAKLSNKQLTIQLEPSQCSLWVLGDQFLLKQSLFNVLDNAVDFAEDKSVIVCSSEVEGRFVTLSIENHGEPIPEYAIHRLTERFYSLPRANGEKSTGLGLNFVDQVIKLHQGQLTIVNTDQGVKVQITLPTP